MKVLLISIALFVSLPSCLFTQILSPLPDTTKVKQKKLEKISSDAVDKKLDLEKDQLVKKGKVLTQGLKSNFRDRLNSNMNSVGFADSVNLNKKSPWNPEVTYNFSMSFDIARGNLNFMSFLPKADVHLELGLFEVNTSIGYNLTQVNRQLISNDFLFGMMPAISLSPKLNLNGILGTQTASIRNIDNRKKTGLGLGIPIRKRKHGAKSPRKMNTNINGVYEETRYTPNEENELLFSDGSIMASRQTYGLQIGNNGQIELSKNGVKINYNTFVMKSLNEKEDFRIGMTTSFIIPLAKTLSFQTNVNYSYENIILQGTKHHDLFLTFGIGFMGHPKNEVDHHSELSN